MKKKINTTEQRKVLADNIKRLLDGKGKTQTDMARDLGFAEATVSSWLNCERYPRIDRVQVMADYFGVYRSDITDDKGESKQMFTSSSYNYYPTQIAAGLPENIESITENDIKKISIPDEIMGKYAGSSDIYITRINGESMNKVIADNSLIAVKPINRSNLKDGDIVIYNYNNEYSAKRYYKQGNEIIFRPDTTDMSFRDHVIDLDDNIDLKIKGKVVLWVTEAD